MRSIAGPARYVFQEAPGGVSRGGECFEQYACARSLFVQWRNRGGCRRCERMEKKDDASGW